MLLFSAASTQTCNKVLSSETNACYPTLIGEATLDPQAVLRFHPVVPRDDHQLTRRQNRTGKPTW